MSRTLPQWLKAQPRGTLTQLMYATHLSWATVSRAARGERVSLRSALLLSRATGGAVAAASLCPDAVEFAVARRKGAA